MTLYKSVFMYSLLHCAALTRVKASIYSLINALFAQKFVVAKFVTLLRLLSVASLPITFTLER